MVTVTKKQLTYDEMLKLKVKGDYTKDITIKEYFHRLLSTLWEEGEGFSGKRPFGDSGWEYDLYKPLIKAGALSGCCDDDDVCVDNLGEAGKLISRLIDHVFAG